MAAGSSSYHDILRSSSIMGGARAAKYLVALVRVKVVAVLLGPSGVGIISLYTTATGLIGAVTKFGLDGSAVRAIAHHNGRDDPQAVARTARTLQRLCWAAGVLGWLLSAALAIPLSQLMFQSTAHAWALAVLGGGLLLTTVSAGQAALLQGLRRIGDIARAQVAAAAANTVVSIALYAWLGEKGIVPVLVINGAVTLGLTWWFAHRVRLEPVTIDWRMLVAEARPMLNLGFALMITAVLTPAVSLYTRTLISRQLGLDAAGLYQAAWALSGMFAGFVLTAMGTDFYPRLTAVIDDRKAAVRMVNEQTEIGILLAQPGLLATLGFAHWAVVLLYSPEFAPAATVLSWMVLGVFGRIISWPLGYIQLALGTGRWYAATEITFIGLQAALVTALVPAVGVVGAGYAFFACYLAYTGAMLLVGAYLIGFRWSPEVLRLVAVCAATILLTFVARDWLPPIAGHAACAIVVVATGLWCLRGLAARVGPEHRVIAFLARIPGLSRLLEH